MSVSEDERGQVMALAQKLRVSAALNGRVQMDLNREDALAVVHLLEAAEGLIAALACRDAAFADAAAALERARGILAQARHLLVMGVCALLAAVLVVVAGWVS